MMSRSLSQLIPKSVDSFISLDIMVDMNHPYITTNRRHSLSRSHFESRACSRCGLPLTDPASFQRGVGPVCAGQDAAIYSRQIPANLPGAVLVLQMINQNEFPDFTGDEELIAKFGGNPRSVIAKIVGDMWKICSEVKNAALENNTNVSKTVGTSVREYVKMIDWILSFKISFETKALLVKAVKEMGYPALGAVLAGRASTGKASISFEEATGYLVLEGSRCKSGMEAFRSLGRNSGIILPKNGDHIYKVPAKFAKEFSEIVAEYWPLFHGDTEAVSIQAKVWFQKNQTKLPTIVKNPKSLSENETIVAVSTDNPAILNVFMGSYNQNVREAFNKLPWKTRRWNGVKRCWDIAIVNKEKVVEILKNEKFIVV